MSKKENEGNNPKVKVEMTEQIYGILMSYLQYENSSFWTRNNFFMVAHSALLGFLITKLQKICPPTSWEYIIIPFVYSIAGLLLSLLWFFGLKKSEKWIEHWRSRLNSIQVMASDSEFPVFPEENKHFGAIQNAYNVVWLFFGLWIILILYFLLAIFMKLCPLIC